MKANHEITATQLDAIAGQVRRWIEWSKGQRDQQGLVTDNDTTIMVLPVAVWPTHGQFETWIGVLDKAATELRQSA